MRQFHPAKLRPWFERGRWNIISLDGMQEAMTLVCVDSWETRRNRLVQESGPNNRLARSVIAAARESGYFDNPDAGASNSVERHYRRDHIQAFRQNWPEFRGQERLVLCSLNADEKRQNPAGTYYLHDGFGRLLAYLYGIAYEGRPYSPIEAFLAESDSCGHPPIRTLGTPETIMPP
jgi:hypothetical protein